MYSVNDNENLTKVRCDNCQKFTVAGSAIEQYDDNYVIAGWDGAPKHPLKTFCSMACKDKYFKESQ